jgi:Flp pilus assembly protein protease CpaA
MNKAPKWLKLVLVCALCIGFATLIALIIERSSST